MRRFSCPSLAAALIVALSFAPALADGPKDNLPDSVRRIPPPGVEVPPEDRQAIEKDLAELRAAIDGLEKSLAERPALLALLPDVEVYYKAVHDALAYDEIFDAKEIPIAKKLVQTGLARARELAEGKASWNTATGLVVRGYRSQIDGSVQPYGLVVPKEFSPEAARQFRLDFWCHGRGEKLSELAFINQRQNSPGEFTPPAAFVLHLYGRYCCANKFAGEIDCFEALADVQKHYPIDENRLVMRGFSMGGAACWQFLVHYPDRFAAAAPGAGFAETARFLNVFQNEQVQPTWYQKKLWRMYDCTDYALNTFNLPVVAYSGEIDRQKQAADVMAEAMKAEGLELVHIIGPKTAHSYEAGAKQKINELIDAAAAKGRNPLPEKIKFTTYTLRYNRCFWVAIDGLDEHWEKARVEAERGRTTTGDAMKIKTQNVSRLVLEFPARAGAGAQATIAIDGQSLKANFVPSGNLLTVRLHKTSGGWAIAKEPPTGPVKKPGLQGPIDDAFLGRFLMVRPTGKPHSEALGKWAADEMQHAMTHWRRQFRGEAPIKNDKDLAADDLEHANLVLWGDPSSNAVLANIAGRLPIQWTKEGVKVGDKTYDAATHVPVLVFPNPLNPERYVVVNSGFTFREYDYLSNARQVPRLPDWTVVDISTPPSSQWPGKIGDAGFFDEEWKLKKGE
ncbi:MAG: prolyl oligopeptidase family serine peptidase [Planctomycetia bacterium]|nr:prolyl oligopeptidase family serine peptidase [Planctomycetia bacterium]